MSKVNLKVGDHVSGLRMGDKAIRLTGIIVGINDDGKTLTIELDSNKNFIETVHVNDVKIIPEKAKTASGKSLTTVNGKEV